MYDYTKYVSDCYVSVGTIIFFFFKQKTAYEMRISDWSSDVCSSDLHDGAEADDEGQDVEIADPPGRPQHRLARFLRIGNGEEAQIGRASCRERVCQYV